MSVPIDFAKRGHAVVNANSSFLELVGQLHEGVVDTDIWEQSLAGICAALHVPALMIGAVSEGGRNVRFQFGHATDPRLIEVLSGPLADPLHNPWLDLASVHPLRRVATVDDVGGPERLQNSRIWAEFYERFGIGDSVGASLERQPDYADILVTGRLSRQPDFGPADLRFVNAILPHLARAWRVKSALAKMESEVGTLQFVLDRLDRAIVVTGPTGKVRFANRAADRLLSRGDGLDARQGRIRATRPRHTDALHGLIGRAAETGVGGASVAVDALAVPSANDNRPIAIVAEPLAPPHSDALGHSANPGAILFISDSEASTRPSVDHLRVVYGLTPAEARLTALVVEGHGVSAVAAELGVSANTAKYHLKTVFEKVGVTRQTQLVRRVLADVGGLAEPATLRPS